jgi:uncharacterized membrane-anchored protein
MRKAFIMLAVLLQILVLAYMAAEREYIQRNGKVIHLRTAPIDPRNLFRGDYVRLNYEISRIPLNKLKAAADIKELKKGAKLYIRLKEGPNGLYELVNAGVEKPNTGIYISGRTFYPYRNLQPGNPIRVNYGIEAYFVEQGKGRDIEKRRGGRTDIQVPLEMEIALGHNGKAVIRGYRWSPLGIGLQVLRSPPRNQQAQEGPMSATVRLTLANVSDTPLAIVSLPDYCSFSLEAVPWSKKSWVPAHHPCGQAIPTDVDVLVLAPQQKKSFDFDFSKERWLVKDDENVKQIGSLDWSEQFRIVYRPPSGPQSQHLSRQELIWHGYLPSRVFHGRGQID